ncbi:MAG TPA: ATP-binding cassette domain-containing protein [Nitrososphaerales archaeon]|nr:ATP-binding cassette domain-containing protein [Nitrososphaerales archaeon]
MRLGEFQLNAELRGGGVICLAGKNGSGKTTLLRALAGFLRNVEGYVVIGGTNVTNYSADKRDIILVTPSTCFPHLKVDSHIMWGANLKKLRPSKEYVMGVKSGLGIEFEGTVGNLSRGMRQRVALATALISSPRVILVDEAFLGLHDREAFISVYGTFAKEGGADVIFSSQDEADGQLSDHLYVMNNGLATLKR